MRARAAARGLRDGAGHGCGVFRYVLRCSGAAVIAVDVGTATSAGRVRSRNEDDFVALGSVFVVADGMGGHAAGDVASRLVTREFTRLAARSVREPRDVAEALGHANEAILRHTTSHAGTEGMGTTAVGLVAVEAAGVDHWLAFNVGDSRLYLFSGGALQQVSTDHSEVEEMVLAGTITREEAPAYARRNIVTRSLGSDPQPLPDQWLLPPTLGDRFLLCSDGLVGELADTVLSAALRGGRSAQDVADDLVAAAVAAGGRDNITVVIVDVVGVAGADQDEDTRPRVAAS